MSQTGGIRERVRHWNERVAVLGTDFFGSMWTFYGFLLLAALPAVLPGLAFALPAIQYASSVVIQLVALPLLAAGANVVGRKSDRIAGETHQALLQELA